jgi:hypothetical protein
VRQGIASAVASHGACNVLPSYCPSSTPDNSISRVFISYAHKDGAKLAAQLKEDFLLETGFDTWLDNTKRLTGSDLWPNAIEKAIDDADIVIALLSHASDVSEVCRGSNFDRSERENA